MTPKQQNCATEAIQPENSQDFKGVLAKQIHNQQLILRKSRLTKVKRKSRETLIGRPRESIPCASIRKNHKHNSMQEEIPLKIDHQKAKTLHT